MAMRSGFLSVQQEINCKMYFVLPSKLRKTGQSPQIFIKVRTHPNTSTFPVPLEKRGHIL